MKAHNTNVIILALIIITICLGFILGLRHYASQPYTVYVEDNVGDYTAITFYPCVVVDADENELAVEFEGEEYACYYDGDATIGDTVWAGFTMCEGERQLVDIQ